MRLRYLLILLLLLTGCGGTSHPYIVGSHAPHDSNHSGVYVVWSNHAGVENLLTGGTIQQGFTVVERARLEQIFAEQRIHLTHTSEDQGMVLRAGQLAGASRIIFADVKIPQNSWDPPQVSVTVRCVAVESARVQWTGSATYAGSIGNHDQAAVALAGWAVEKATCREEDGDVWTNLHGSPWEGGCASNPNPPPSGKTKPALPAIPAPPDLPIWKDMDRMEQGI